MTQQRPNGPPPHAQRYIVYARRGGDPGRALGSALAKLEHEPGVRVDQVHGSRTDPRRLVITATPEVVTRLVQEFDGIAYERDLRMKLDDSHGYAPKPTDVSRRKDPIPGPE